MIGQDEVQPVPRADPAIMPEAMIVVGGSAGSFYPLRELIAGLPADLPAAVLIAIHRGERTPSHLAEILGRAGPLPAGQARDGERVGPGRIYVAPPSRHLMSSYGRIRLSGGPRVNRHRPAVDVLFASTARWARSRTLAVVLSGVLDDGAVGAALVAHAGGQVLVQDPAAAHFASMPATALAAAPGARALPDAGLAAGVLEHLKTVTAGTLPGMHVHGREAEMDMADSDDPGFLAEGETRLTRMVCPECGGALAQVDLPQISYFRCHIGHQYAPRTLAAAQADAAESKLWGAVAAMEEQAALQHYLRKLDSAKRATTSPDEHEQFAQRISERAGILREQVRQWTAPAPPQLEEPSA
jgi:two-component system, chemotaxis family, protein-glutamate methylesterase/glutaminase